MQHNIEDQPKLTTLEAAWKQVEQASNQNLDVAIEEAFNTCPTDVIDITHQDEKETEVEKDDIDVDDETGRASGSSWTEIEVRTTYTVEGQLPPELNARLKDFNEVEVSRKVEEILRNNKDPRLVQFKTNLASIVGNDVEDMFDFGYDGSTGEFGLTIEGAVNDESSQDATADHHDAAAERKDPYAYRGLSRSDFL